MKANNDEDKNATINVNFNYPNLCIRVEVWASFKFHKIIKRKKKRQVRPCQEKHRVHQEKFHMHTSTDKNDQSDEEDFELTDTEEPSYIVEAPCVDSALLAISLDFLVRLNFLHEQCNIP